MKFAIVVMLALAFEAHCSVLPLGLGLSPWGVSQLGWPTLAGTTVLTSTGHILAQGPTITSELVPGGIATSVVGPTPGVVDLAGSPWIAGAPQGAYVAKTRGAVHAAPLPGHVNSAASINLQPAPGTV